MLVAGRLKFCCTCAFYWVKVTFIVRSREVLVVLLNHCIEGVLGDFVNSAEDLLSFSLSWNQDDFLKTAGINDPIVDVYVLNV